MGCVRELEMRLDKSLNGLISCQTLQLNHASTGRLGLPIEVAGRGHIE